MQRSRLVSGAGALAWIMARKVNSPPWWLPLHPSSSSVSCASLLTRVRADVVVTRYAGVRYLTLSSGYRGSEDGGRGVDTGILGAAVRR